MFERFEVRIFPVAEMNGPHACLERGRADLCCTSVICSDEHGRALSARHSNRFIQQLPQGTVKRDVQRSLLTMRVRVRRTPQLTIPISRGFKVRTITILGYMRDCDLRARNRITCIRTRKNGEEGVGGEKVSRKASGLL